MPGARDDYLAIKGYVKIPYQTNLNTSYILKSFCFLLNTQKGGGFQN